MDILVLGAGYAGVMTALRLHNRGMGDQVTLVNAIPELVERIRHHELGAAKAPLRRALAELLAGTRIKLVVGRVSALDLEQQRARLSDGRELSFDRLVYALGSVADDNGVPGVRQHALLLGDEAGAATLRARLQAGAREVVVVGGGLSGVEIATELAGKARVTLITADGIGAFLAPAGQKYLRERLLANGVRIVEGAIQEVRSDAVVLDGETLPCDACVWAGGFRAPSLAKESGLAVNERGQILVDERLRSLSHPNLYAVGDAAEPSFDAGAPIRMGCKYAVPMGAHAAENLARSAKGKLEQPFRFGDTGFCISLGRKDGLIQLNHADGSASGMVTGWWAARIKELVCRFTVWSLQLERRFVFYRWRMPPKKALVANPKKQLAA